MYQLQSAPEPFWLDVLPGVRIQFKPLLSAGVIVARGAASRMPEGTQDDEKSFAFTIAAACWGALDWEGIGDEVGEPLPLTPAALASLMEQEPGAYDSIDLGYVVPALLRSAEKNVSSASQNGTSTAAKTIAKRVPKSATPVRPAKTSRKRQKA